MQLMFWKIQKHIYLINYYLFKKFMFFWITHCLQNKTFIHQPFLYSVCHIISIYDRSGDCGGQFDKGTRFCHSQKYSNAYSNTTKCHLFKSYNTISLSYYHRVTDEIMFHVAKMSNNLLLVLIQNWINKRKNVYFDIRVWTLRDSL